MHSARAQWATTRSRIPCKSHAERSASRRRALVPAPRRRHRRCHGCPLRVARTHCGTVPAAGAPVLPKPRPSATQAHGTLAPSRRTVRMAGTGQRTLREALLPYHAQPRGTAIRIRGLRRSARMAGNAVSRRGRMRAWTRLRSRRSATSAIRRRALAPAITPLVPAADRLASDVEPGRHRCRSDSRPAIRQDLQVNASMPCRDRRGSLAKWPAPRSCIRRAWWSRTTWCLGNGRSCFQY